MRILHLLIFLLLSTIGIGQCNIFIVPNSATVIDHDPGISFVFEIQNDSDAPYFGGDLYLDWSLSGGASGPIWEFDFGVFPILPGESKYVSTPSFDIPLPENVPGNWSPYAGWSGDEFSEYFRITLDENVNFNDSDCYQWMLDGDGGYWNEPLSDSCSNLNGDNFCDDQCNLEVVDFNLETTELTIIPNSTYCPNLGSPLWQSQYPFDNPYVFGFQLNFNWGSNQITISIGGQQIYESDESIVIDLSGGLLGNLAYQNMIEGIENGDICDLDLTLFNSNNSGQPLWEVNDNQTVEITDLCPIINDVIDLSLDTILYDVGCDGLEAYWTPEIYITNNGDIPISEYCIKFQILGQSNDTICFNTSNVIAPGETFIQDWPNVYDWGVLSLHLLDVNGESEQSWNSFGLDVNISNNMYVQTINNAPDCEPEEIPGCTDINAINYNPLATIDDGSCIEPIIGCMIPNALNYNPEANITCEPIIECCIFPIYGCTDETANNFNPEANSDDESCTYDVLGCTDSSALNFDPLANIDDGNCEYDVFGCTNPFASNYNPLATVDDGSCVIYLGGCTDPEALNYNPQAIEDDGSCVYDDFCNEIFAPNTFTPNNDGVNDIWTLVTDPSCWVSWHILIYDRWGRLVWESTTPGEVWIGSNYKGNHYISDGIYVYTAKGVGYNPNNTFQKSGYITIFR